MQGQAKYPGRRSGTAWSLLTLIVVGLLLIAALSLLYLSTVSAKGRPLVVYTADAYSREVQYLYNSFSNSTGIPYSTPKAGGSFILARQIAEGSPSDVFFSASLTALTPQYLGGGYSGWALAIASDQMILAYSDSSPAVQPVISDYSNAASSNLSSAWFRFFSDMTSGSLRVGIADPNSDPAGLRGWLVLEAAGLEYAGNQSYFVDRMIGNSANLTASNAAELVAPLEGGQIQLLFIYRSTAISLELHWMELPAHVNLGDESLSGFYSQLSYRTVSGLQNGSPILLFVTVPSGASDMSHSILFVSYVVQHNQELSAYGLVPLKPCLLYNSTAVPPKIAELLESGSATPGGGL
jgi:molybdate/tungstate transport system substrate-binding protein